MVGPGRGGSRAIREMFRSVTILATNDRVHQVGGFLCDHDGTPPRRVLERDVPPTHQILIVQACAVVVTILAGVSAGLIAASWIWAMASAVVIYAASQAAVMAWAGWWMITRRRRPGPDDWRPAA
jgi:hypothetical protein